MFLIQLFAGACLEGPSGPLTGRVAQRRRVALLAILALEHPRPVARDKLIALLWPEHDTERARHLLRDSIYLIRNALDEDSLLGTGDELRLNPRRVSCDVWAFDEALRQDRLEVAARAYAGPLLDGFHVGDSSELEHWFDAARERLAREYMKALKELAEQASATGDPESAVVWWRQLGASDRYNARVTLRLMEALDAVGDRAGAIQQARIHAALMEQEFSADPDPEVTDFAERLRTQPVSPAAAGRGADDPVVEASFTTPTAARDGERDQEAPAPERGTSARTRRGFSGWKYAGLIAAAPLLALAAMLAAGRLIPRSNPAETTERVEATTKALAVLPFANLSRDPDEDYFSDGLTEELIGVLSGVSGLRVAARTSAFAFKGKDQDIRDIGRSLNVGAVVEGSVRRDGDRVRVIAQLINVADGFHLWSHTYEREVTDIFAIQSDLALRIAQSLEAELTPQERKRLAHRPTANSQAYVLYLKGRYFWNQRTDAGYARAIDYFQQAIEADSQYAAAYAGLGTVYSMLGLSGGLSAAEASEQTKQAALKALALDDDLAEAHTVLGGYWHAHAWDSDTAEREHLRAIELDPSYATARHWYGNLLRSMGRLEDALAQIAKAVELDPLSPVFTDALGHTLLMAGRPDDAFQQLRNAIELDSTYWRAWANLGAVHESIGTLDEAVRSYERANELAGWTADVKAGLARVLALAGREEGARRILAELQADVARTGIHAPGVATVFLALGDPDAALAWLERSYDQRHPQLRFIGGQGFERLEDDPRYVDLLRRLELRS